VSILQRRGGRAYFAGGAGGRDHGQTGAAWKDGGGAAAVGEFGAVCGHFVSGSTTLRDYGAKWLPGILSGDWYRLITAGYLHVQFLHILMNMMGLFNLGPLVEEVYGTRRMFALYTVATVFGFILSAMWSPRTYSLGASAGIFGLLGALIAYGVHSKSFAAKHLQQQCLLNAGIGFAMGGFMPMIDNAAHLGGLAGGFAVAYLAGLPEDSTDAKEKLWGLLSLVSLLLTLLAFIELSRRIAMHNALPFGAG